MAMCDLSDISIYEAFDTVVKREDGATNWMLLGYYDDNVITLLSYGDQGIRELKQHLEDEILYGFFSFQDRFIFLDWVPPNVSMDAQDRRKRHLKSVMRMLSDLPPTYQSLIHLKANTVEELDDEILLALTNPSHKNNEVAYEQTANHNKFDEQTNNSDNDDEAEIKGIDEEVLDSENEDENLRREQQRHQMELQQHQQLLQQQRKQQEQRQRQLEMDKERERMELLKKEQEATQMKQQMMDAIKTKQALLVGYASVKSDASPLWRRRFITIQDDKLLISRDDFKHTPITAVTLTTLARYGKCDPAVDCSITNAIILETNENETWQVLADSKKELELILVALNIVISQ